jgi:hypothetical protein
MPRRKLLLCIAVMGVVSALSGFIVDLRVGGSHRHTLHDSTKR